jgi:transcriptional antiterminator NusG
MSDEQNDVSLETDETTQPVETTESTPVAEADEPVSVIEATDADEADETTDEPTPTEAPVEPVETADEPTEETPSGAPAEQGKWYVVHTQSGFESKAKEALEQRIKTLGFSDRIFEVIVPMRDIVTINKGQKKQKKEKVFPGYILVRMILDNDSWIVVRTTQGITGFVGAGTKPTAISDKEVEAIMRFVKQEQPKFKAKFSIGEVVKVTDGPFSDFVGTINNMDEDKGKVTVLVSIFGRETPVELDFLQVSKL